MTNSDIIAITAIVISGIISIATLIATYLTNRANNKSKLTELTFEKRLDALRDVYTATCRQKIEFFDLTYDIVTNQRIDFGRDAAKYTKIVDDFENVYNTNRIFIPKHIDDMYQFYREIAYKELNPHELNQAVQTKDFKAYDVAFEKHQQHANLILQEMQKFLGYK